GGALQLAAATVGGGLAIDATGGTTLATLVSTAGAISFTGSLTLGAAVTLNTTAGGALGSAITLGAVLGGGQSLTLNAGGVGDIALQTVGTAGAPLAAVTITNARNVTGSGLIATNGLTQSAGTGTTNFGGAGVSATGAVALTTGVIAGVYNVGSFTVTSSQTVATGSVGGVSGTAAAALASAPGATGTQTFNGCTIGTVCSSPAAAATPIVTTAQAVAIGQSVTATSATSEVVGAITHRPAPSSDPNSSTSNGFEVAVPTQNVDWSNPTGDLHVTMAPEFHPIKPCFSGSSQSGASGAEETAACRGAR
ncbi:MAG: hypothetical protein HY060_22920, partial [Proteobacteria bacterium]|nr:hypothetical protein [Pseudomonadota bacterium]